MSQSNVPVIQIGAGGFGRYHLKCWNDVPNGEIVGIYDVDHKAAQKAAEEFGVSKVFKTLDDALSSKLADAVTIVVPNMFHTELTVKVLQAGKHCFCEKPLAPTADDIKTMIAARDKSGKLLMTGQHMRFEGKTKAVKTIIDAGRLGDVYYAKANWLRQRGVPATPGFITKAQAARGPGADIGVHVLDLSMYLMGFPRPVAVSGTMACKLAKTPGRFSEWGDFDPDLYDVEDFAAGWVRFDNGCVLLLEVSWMLNMVEQETYGIELFGTQGGVQWPSMKWVEETQGTLTTGQIKSVREKEGHRGEFEAFCDAVHKEGPSPVPAEQSLMVGQVLDALYESAKTEREVVIK